MQQKALILAQAVYRVSKLFPEGEVLIGQLRQVAGEIISEISIKHYSKAVLKIKALLNLFILAQAQEWTNQVNFVILIKEYNYLLAEIKSQLSLEKQDILNIRQKKIISYLKKNRSSQLKNLCLLLPGLTARTLRNDLKYLTENNYIVQKGRGRSSFYQIIKEK